MTQALTPAEADVETVERVAGVLDNFENGFGYELHLTRLVDGEETHTLTYNDGSEPIDFSDRNDAYAHIQHRRSQDRARAVIASLAALPPRPANASKPDMVGDSVSWVEDGVAHHHSSVSRPADDVASIRIRLGDEIHRDLVERGHASCGQRAVQIASMGARQPSDDVAKLREALRKCRAQFEFYVAQHLAKSPPDMDKAATNQEFVEMIYAALADEKRSFETSGEKGK